MSVDKRELQELAKDFENLPKTVDKYIPKALEVTGRNIKDDWNSSVKPVRGYKKHFPYSITYDKKNVTLFGHNIFEVEIGPEKDRKQGRLGNLIEFGSKNNGPGLHGQKALRKNQNDFVDGLEKAISDGLRDAGLG